MNRAPGVAEAAQVGGRADPASGPFAVLAVCTGNICRSPAVELWLRAALGPASASGVIVASAGLRAVVGAGVCGDMVPLIEAGGGRVAGFRARQVTGAMLRESDLVLALARGHRAALVEMAPAAVARTFTVRELARILQGIDRTDPRLAEVRAAPTPGERLRALTGIAARRRRAHPVRPEDDDVIDPIGQGPAVAARAAEQIRAAVLTIAAAARGELPA